MTASLSASPTHVVIGATDPERMRAFFAAFGFVADLEREGSMVRGAGHRTELQIDEARAGRRLADYDRGPRGLDIYTRDISATVAAARSFGAEVGPVADVAIGSMQMRQVTVWGPDDLPLVAIENSSRRSSLLDTDPHALHSEIHSLVWAVDDRDCDSAWFADQGAVPGMNLSFAEPAVATFMKLPDPVVAVDMVMLADDENSPIRFELLEFVDRPGAAFTGADQAGIQAIGYTDPQGTERRTVSPGGVVVDLRN